MNPVILLLTAAIAAGLVVIRRGVLQPFSNRLIWGFIFITVIALGGLATWKESRSLDQFWRIQSWPKVQANILSARVAGKRAFHPEIVYEYEVAGRAFRDTTDMDVPGFGTKANRLNVAEQTIAANSVGSKLTVAYNPNRPEQSAVHRWPRFNVFILYTIGILLVGTGVFGFIHTVFIGSSKAK
ncbi:MAG: DUF3592 domain-containing protein [Bacteroidetes bacterium]|nr:DUF3592 domain-containing protein [Bacteroidota bacterium]